MSPISLEEAWEKQCPYQARNCVGPNCMAWVTDERAGFVNAETRTASSIEQAGPRPEGVTEHWTFVPETRTDWAHWVPPKDDVGIKGRCRLL